MLAFYPSKQDADLHKLEVRLKGKPRKLTLRHRESFRSRDPDRFAAERAVTALLLDETSNPLGVELVAEAPRPANGASVRLPLRVVFPVAGLTLVPEGIRHRGQVSIYLTSGDLARGAAQVQKAVVPLGFTDEQLADARKRSIRRSKAVYRVQARAADAGRQTRGSPSPCATTCGR